MRHLLWLTKFDESVERSFDKSERGQKGKSRSVWMEELKDDEL